MEALQAGRPRYLETQEMSSNDLLIWMSARVEGSWPQFRSATEGLQLEKDAGESTESSEDATASSLPLYQAVRLGLERLAHVEFTSVSNSRRWRVVPPTLAIASSGDECVGILCGARSPSLSASLLQPAGNVSVDSLPMPGMPDRIRLVSADITALGRAGQDLGLFVQLSAPVALLAAIPPVDDPRSRFPSEAPSTPGWTIHRFSPTSLRWRETDLQYALGTSFGLFRFQLRFQRFHFLRWRGRTFQVPVQVGKYVVLQRSRIRQLVWHDRSEAVFSVPVTCRPPLLIERALVLCSGELPRVDRLTGRLEYSRVTPEIARLAAALLCQEIHIS